MNKDYVMDIRKKLKTHDLIMVPSASIVPVNRGKVMLQKRTDTNTWGILGGGIQYGEKIKDTAIRELFEETNLECENLKEFGIYSIFPIEYTNGDKVNAFTIAFICSIKDENSFKANDEETIEVQWFSFDELNTIDFWNSTSKEIARDAFQFIKDKKFILK